MLAKTTLMCAASAMLAASPAWAGDYLAISRDPQGVTFLDMSSLQKVGGLRQAWTEIVFFTSRQIGPMHGDYMLSLDLYDCSGRRDATTQIGLFSLDGAKTLGPASGAFHPEMPGSPQSVSAKYVCSGVGFGKPYMMSPKALALMVRADLGHWRSVR